MMQNISKIGMMQTFEAITTPHAMYTDGPRPPLARVIVRQRIVAQKSFQTSQ
jgi:hypothetical protein